MPHSDPSVVKGGRISKRVACNVHWPSVLRGVCQQLSPDYLLDGAMVLVHPMGNGQDPLGPRQVSLGVIDRELSNVLNAKVISGLDALRALAVSLVLIDHFMLTDHFFGVRLGVGSIGVMIFFVLSGFLITSMLLREFRRTGGISLSNFYRRRAYRIFPTFYCCWILTTVVECLAHQFYWKTAAASFFYFMDYWRAFAPQSVQSHMWVSWSLAIEEKFYLLWPLLLLFLLKKRTRIVPALVLIILGQWVYRAVLSLVFQVRWSYIYNTFDMRVDAILVGCLLAILVENNGARLLCCSLLRWKWLSVLPPLALGFAALAPLSNKAAGLAIWSFQPLIVAAMLLQAIYWGWKSWTICSSVIVRAVAQLSYALYLYHPLAGKIVYLLHIPHLGYNTAFLTLAMAMASYHLIERPFMRMRDHDKPPPGAAAPAGTIQSLVSPAGE
jgi:peptidoglycan/LPS O-acetylase OafA/YrhL